MKKRLNRYSTELGTLRDEAIEAAYESLTEEEKREFDSIAKDFSQNFFQMGEKGAKELIGKASMWAVEHGYK